MVISLIIVQEGNEKIGLLLIYKKENQFPINLGFCFGKFT